MKKIRKKFQADETIAVEYFNGKRFNLLTNLLTNMPSQSEKANQRQV